MGLTQSCTKPPAVLARYRKTSSTRNSRFHYNKNLMSRNVPHKDLTNKNFERNYYDMLFPYQFKVMLFSDPNIDYTTSYECRDASFEVIFQDIQNDIEKDSELWPLDIHNSIFVFLNEVKNTHFKVFIAGASYTPYAHGLFEFDITLRHPNRPPKVDFLSGGSDGIRFGPRFSNTSKVKLSKLGTYFSSDDNEVWTPQRPLSELLLSLQELVKTNNLCEGDIPLKSLNNDPNNRRRMNKACGNIVKFYTLENAMLSHLRTPIPWLKEFIQLYFYMKKDIILAECKKWLIAAQNDDGIYDGFTSFYNPTVVNEFSEGKNFTKLSNKINELEKQLNKLTLSIDAPIIPEQITSKDGNYSESDTEAEVNIEANID